MPTLFPPDYPDRPDAPLLSFGPAFSEEISRSVIGCVWRENHERPHETDVRVAASLTMFEAFHPRDQLDCMLAAQGVGFHAAIMDSLERAMQPGLKHAEVVKYRSNATQMSRAFSVVLRDLALRQSKPLPERPVAPPAADPAPPPDGPPPTDGSAEPQAAPTPPPVDPPEEPELPEDLVTRPDGTPGTLAAYAPKPPKQVVIPLVAPIMLALATRPRPWRQLNDPPDPTAPDQDIQTRLLAAVAPRPGPAAEPVTPSRGPLDMREPMFTGDALARYASTRVDPDAPVRPPPIEEDEAVFELEMISTGGDPEAEAQRQAMMAAHPEGKPIVTFDYRGKKPPDKPPQDP
jgi:hypothetical protein